LPSGLNANTLMLVPPTSRPMNDLGGFITIPRHRDSLRW
jgi:hypothetical protein